MATEYRMTFKKETGWEMAEEIPGQVLLFSTPRKRKQGSQLSTMLGRVAPEESGDRSQGR